MIELNRILIQLNKAVECANSEFPQERSIGVILFDNLVEIQLYKRAEIAMLWDRTTWYGGNRFYNARSRNKALSYYDNLLKFSKDNKTISERDFGILKYAHSIRNGIYHKGSLDNLKIDLAILIFYDFAQRYLHKWDSPSGLIAYADLPGYRKIDFGQGLSKKNVLEHEAYFSSSVNYILSKLKITEGLDEKVQSILFGQIERIKKAIGFIKTESKWINFYDVIGRYWYLNDDFLGYVKKGRKPKNLDSILILYEFLRTNRDYLDDIADLKQRQKEGKSLLKELRSQRKGKYQNWTDLERIQKRIENLKGRDSSFILKNLIDIENKIAYLYTDLDEAFSDLDGYIMNLADLARGK